MNSTEYPDLPFVEPAAWGSGRDGKAVRYVVIHYTAGSERSTSAEDGAAYDTRRTDGTSTHYFVDQDSIVQCVLTRDRANAARHRGNRLGIQYELCGTQQTRAQWLDTASLATLKNAARQVARDCVKYGLPARRLSVAETRACWTDYPNGPKGIVGHVDCTNAYPEDGGDHTDPGPEFPWDVFLGLVKTEIEEMNMPDANEISAEIIKDVRNTKEFLSDTQVGIVASATAVAVAARLKTQLDQLTTLALGEKAEVPPTPEQNATAVLAALADAGRTDAEIAEALRAALGDRAASVGHILAG